jgi:ABC-type multidrug transport system fused ATPase/permease subunit
MVHPALKYEIRKEKYEKLLINQDKAINAISRLRLFDAVAAILTFTFFYRSKDYYIAAATTLIYLVIFIYLVIIHSKARYKKQFISSLHKVNASSAARFSDDWKNFSDTGEDFRDDGHPFSQDLDIFGKSSLFQLINTSTTIMGRKRLKQMLSEPCKKIDKIKIRQESVNELSRLLWWRQRFASEGMMLSDKALDEEDLFSWARRVNKVYTTNWASALIFTAPLITISTLIFSYGFHLIPTYIFKLLGIIQFAALFLFGKERNNSLNTVFAYKNNIKSYAKMLRHFEEFKFKSPHINNLQKELIDSQNKTASKQIKKLQRIVESINNRRNPMFLPINVLLLWDYRCMVSLEKWKMESGNLVKRWFEVIGELEALSSITVLRHDHPGWAIAELTEEPSFIKAKALAHPLLTGKQVSNDLSFENSKTLLITGSNMSGKSTLLRTTGINLILAYCGAPVCADYFKCSIMNVHTCMRVSDNLEKSISSFYAELLRIKDIVSSSKGDGQVFFLLDEIFKGTNSQDRHLGAKFLIKQLIRDGAIGMVSTHDLELGELEKTSGGAIKNYHFQEYYKDNQIYFDYKLRPGVSTTRNALYLIKMAGIDTDIDDTV